MLIKKVVDGVREGFGNPATLQQLLRDCPDIRVSLAEPARCIDAQSIPLWHELGTQPVLEWPRRDRGQLMGYRSSGGRWESVVIERPEYSQLGQRSILESWSCDITEIDGFSSSKSELQDFTSTDQMVEANSSEMINEVSEEMLAKNLAHREIRIIHSPGTTDHFARYAWDGRLWLINDGGSHHTAAAKYIAARLRLPVTLTGCLYTYSLNAIAIASLRREFEMFVINDEPEISNAFFNAMKAFEAPWFWHDLPRPYQQSKGILLPRSEPRSMRVAAELRTAGIVDLGQYLARLAARQISF